MTVTDAQEETWSEFVSVMELRIVCLPWDLLFGLGRKLRTEVAL